MRYPIASEELYALRSDPAEAENVTGARPGETMRLRRLVEEWQRTHHWEDGSRRFRDRTIPERIREELDALGYVP